MSLIAAWGPPAGPFLGVPTPAWSPKETGPLLLGPSALQTPPARRFQAGGPSVLLQISLSNSLLSSCSLFNNCNFYCWMNFIIMYKMWGTLIIYLISHRWMKGVKTLMCSLGDEKHWILCLKLDMCNGYGSFKRQNTSRFFFSARLQLCNFLVSDWTKTCGACLTFTAGSRQWIPQRQPSRDSAFHNVIRALQAQNFPRLTQASALIFWILRRWTCTRQIQKRRWSHLPNLHWKGRKKPSINIVLTVVSENVPADALIDDLTLWEHLVWLSLKSAAAVFCDQTCYGSLIQNVRRRPLCWTRRQRDPSFSVSHGLRLSSVLNSFSFFFFKHDHQSKKAR